jgi:signal transduction histidine kinase
MSSAIRAHRPRLSTPAATWLAFALCAALGLGVLAWFSRAVLRLEREAEETRRVAAIEENLRLALWRIDSAVAAIHGSESARPAGDYLAFAPAPAACGPALEPLPFASVLLPSPLLDYVPPFVRLHFQIETDGTLVSPQAPPFGSFATTAAHPSSRFFEAARALAELRTRLDVAAVRAAAGLEAERTELASSFDFPDARPDSDTSSFAPKRLASEAETPAEPQVETQVASDQLLASARLQRAKSAAEQKQRGNLLLEQNQRATTAANRAWDFPEPDAAAGSDPAAAASPSIVAQASPLPASVAHPGSPIDSRARIPAQGRDAAASVTAGSLAAKHDAPSEARDRADAGSSPRSFAGELVRAEGAAMADEAAKSLSLDAPLPPPAAKGRFGTAVPPPAATFTGPLQPLWSGGELLFARRAVLDGRLVVQGVWIDWPALEASLIERVADLLPAAQLVPRSAPATASAHDATRRLAFIPVSLVPGPVALGEHGAWSLLRASLVAAWAGALVGAAALAALLAGTLRLSERRAAFVSSVTHELRTPLTTFRMYTEMLAGGMVPDEAKRRGYIDTLRKEAERLSHLVENVLCYARLERGRASSRVEDAVLGDLLGRIEERLRLRAEQGGLALRVALAPGLVERTVRTDTTAVEQILFNLVDNAAKYARPREGSAELLVSVEPGRAGQTVVRVADHGPGLPAAARKRLFRPFSKSATEAAHSQPGVGLGLALSRRLARDELGGDLVLERTGPDGTVFRLDLGSSRGIS